MGNVAPRGATAAHHVTTSNDDEGFATAVDRFILGGRKQTVATDTPMQLGMVGLGRMGAGIVRRLVKDGTSHCVGYDVLPDAVKALEADGTPAVLTRGFAAKLRKPRAAWVMVPAGRSPTDDSRVAEVLEPATRSSTGEHALRRRHPTWNEPPREGNQPRRRRHERRRRGASSAASA